MPKAYVHWLELVTRVGAMCLFLLLLIAAAQFLASLLGLRNASAHQRLEIEAVNESEVVTTGRSKIWYGDRDALESYNDGVAMDAHETSWEGMQSGGLEV